MLSPRDATLLDVVRMSVEHGVEYGSALEITLDDYDPELQRQGACFVTHHVSGALHGCTGSLEPSRPLVEDVAYHAFSAAFRDPRFPPLRRDELPNLESHISILNPAEPIAAESEESLQSALRPGIDGVILQCGGRRATFLPAVWDQLPDPRDFLDALKSKAGLTKWSSDVRALRYTVREIPD